MDVEQFLDQPTIGFFINGEFCHPDGRQFEKLVSPATGNEWKTFIPATAEDAQQAILSAEKAFSTWKQTTPAIRVKYLLKIGELIDEYTDEFAHLMATEMGKPITQGKAEAVYAASYFRWYAGEAERVYGRTIPSAAPNKRLLIAYQPVGVCAAITPWNFPLAMGARKAAAALAAGCAIINKPSEVSPITMLLFAHLCNMAELPPGLVSIIPGPAEKIGDALLSSEKVRKLTFTGSTAVGKLLYQKSGATLKKLSLELGGHAPLLVFDDADIDLAVEGTIMAKFRNNGQTCVCPNRVFVQDKVFETYSQKLTAAIKQLKIGDPFDPETDLSPILHPESVKKVKAHTQDALEKGAKSLLSGKEVHEPTVLCDVTSAMILWKEETFGPVVPLIRFSTEEEAIAMANESVYGLSSYVFTQNLSRATRVVEALEYGVVGVNDGMPSAPQASLGGIKQSGFGREGGPTSIFDYLVEKYVSMRV